MWPENATPAFQLSSAPGYMRPVHCPAAGVSNGRR